MNSESEEFKDFIGKIKVAYSILFNKETVQELNLTSIENSANDTNDLKYLEEKLPIIFENSNN
jgi:hypothetical protein